MRGLSTILIYMPSFGGGGAERNAALLAREFSRRGYNVVMAVDQSEGPNRDLLSNSVEVRALEGRTHWSDARALRRILRQVRPEVAYARVGASHLKILTAALGILPLSRIVISYHSLYDMGARPGERLTYWLAAVLTRVMGATIAVSSDIKEELVRRFRACGKKISVVHNPVDLGWVEAQSKGRCFLGREEGSYILSVGRLIHLKDFSTLLRAFSLIHKKIKQDLIVLGEGPLRENLERQVAELNLADRVHLPGYQSNPFPLYRGADLFVLSSVFEGFGNVLVEALALGLPVVATQCPGGPKEILEGGRLGRLVPVGDPKALADAMLATLAKPLAASLLRARAKDFAVEKVADTYLEVAGLSAEP